jgi:hypothetical protein
MKTNNNNNSNNETKKGNNRAQVFNYNGQQFTMSATFKGNKYGVFGDNMTHPAFVVTIKTDNDCTRFNFYASHNDFCNGVTSLDRDGLRNALDCFLSDGLCYDNARDFSDFCADMGYNDIGQYKKALAAWNGCKRHHATAARLFGSNYAEIINEINEE